MTAPHELKETMENQRLRILMEGGVHNCNPVGIWLQVSQLQIEDFFRSSKSLDEIVEETLSDEQRQRLERYFCGIKGCRCGSYHRATKQIW